MLVDYRCSDRWSPFLVRLTRRCLSLASPLLLRSKPSLLLPVIVADLVLMRHEYVGKPPPATPGLSTRFAKKVRVAQDDDFDDDYDLPPESPS